MKTSTSRGSPRRSSNYRSTKVKPQAPKPKVEPVAVPKRKAVPLPGAATGDTGSLLAAALKAKVRLLKHLLDVVGNPVSVSVEVHDDQWVLLVHGPRPPMKYFDDYKVFWARSKVLAGQK